MQSKEEIRTGQCDIMHIITGIGRSGTSFVSEVCKNLDYDMGSKTNFDTINAGYELSSVVEINEMFIRKHDGEELNNEKLVEINKSMVDMSNKTAIVKDPRFLLTLNRWAEAGAQIDGIIYCKRDFLEISRSTIAADCNGMLGIFAKRNWSEHMMTTVAEMWEIGFLNIANRYGINVDIVSFPDSLVDFNQILPLKCIEPNEDKLYKAWSKAINPIKEYK